MKKQFDWPIMLERLEREIPLTVIAKMTDTPISTLRKVKEERTPASSWDNAIAIFDLYLQAYDAKIPRMGDYNV